MITMKVMKSTQPKETEVQIKPTSYAEACKYIRSAIDILGKSAKDDVLAQESIANLGVVLLDLNK